MLTRWAWLRQGGAALAASLLVIVFSVGNPSVIFGGAQNSFWIMSESEAETPFAVEGVDIIDKTVEKECVRWGFVSDDLSKKLAGMNDLRASLFRAKGIVDNFWRGQFGNVNIHGRIAGRGAPVIQAEYFNRTPSLYHSIAGVYFGLERGPVIRHSNIGAQLALSGVIGPFPESVSGQYKPNRGEHQQEGKQSKESALVVIHQSSSRGNETDDTANSMYALLVFFYFCIPIIAIFFNQRIQIILAWGILTVALLCLGTVQ